jgi:BirA family biotin operon repressor/biotin-[acetyl-CoA-carboxylase] ligase
LEIRLFEAIDSTQKQLIKDLKSGHVSAPIAYFSTHQTAGIGSRGNSWIGKKGNFYLSFALKRDELPQDLPLASASIYFSYILKEELQERGSRVWLKWPNDFYLEKKVGGCITQLMGDMLVCGIGLNVAEAPQDFAKLDIRLDPILLAGAYLRRVEEKISWKQIFSKYRIEFYKNCNYSVHYKGVKISMRGAELMDDGSVMIDGERIYSLR